MNLRLPYSELYYIDLSKILDVFLKTKIDKVDSFLGHGHFSIISTAKSSAKYY